MKVAVILPAAGLGTRMGRTSAETAGTSRKQFMLLEGSPILLHTVRKFAASDRVSEIVIALRREDLAFVDELLRQEIRNKPVRVVEGGNSRQESVERGLAAVSPDTDLVAVHDAAADERHGVADADARRLLAGVRDVEVGRNELLDQVVA